jgi:hypothetical protein
MITPVGAMTQEDCMPRTWSAKWNQPKHWRLRATAADGLIVTLGRYETAEEAHADRGHFAEQGGYRNLTVQPIELRPDPSSAEGTPR